MEHRHPAGRGRSELGSRPRPTVIADRPEAVDPISPVTGWPSRPSSVGPPLPSAGAIQRLADAAGASGAALAIGWDPVGAAVLALVTVAVVGPSSYRARLDLSFLGVAPSLAVRVFVATVTAAGLVGPTATARSAILAAAIMTAAVLVARATAVAGIVEARRRRWLATPALLVGDTDDAAELAAILDGQPRYGLVPTGTWVPPVGGQQILLDEAVDRVDAEVVIFLPGLLDDHQFLRVVRSRPPGVQAFVALPLGDLFGAEARDDLDLAWNVPLLRLPRSGADPVDRRLKRLADVVGATIALLALTPVLAVVALAVAVVHGRPVLFRQERVGLGGRPITVTKFRTISWVDGGGDTAETLWHPSLAGDRVSIGRLGRFLRATSLDELPQLFAVLSGSMSLVGPRPERPRFAAHYARRYPHYGSRHRMVPGITGLSQVLGLRGDTSIAERARFDNRYIDRWSFGLDLRILLRTVVAVVRAGGR